LVVWVGLLGLIPAGDVTDLSIHSAAQRTDVLIAVSGPVQFRDFTMEGPTRLIVDLMGARHALPATNFMGLDRGGIRSVRTSQYSDDVVRVVLELHERVGYQVVAGEGHLRISLENRNGSFDPWSASSPEVLPGGLQAPPPAPRVVAPVVPAAPVVTTPVGLDRRTRPIQQQGAPRITVQFAETPIREVLFTFAEFSGRSIVPGSGVAGNVNAEIRDQPWDIALREILISQGLSAVEDPATGIIRVDDVENLTTREQVDQLITQAYPISYATAEELRTAVEPLLSDRGRASVVATTNTLVVMDIPRVQESVGALLEAMDIQTPMISISAKIIFVNRTDLNEFGVVYDLKDSRGNQLNLVTPGAVDLDGDGVIRLPDEQVDIGTDVISLGGASIAALGNANNRVAGPSLTLLTSLIVGRHTLINFIEALQSVNLSDVEATPSVQVLDNREARILVGERTPIRVIDAQAGGAGAGAGAQAGGLPQATVQIEETGIALRVKPHVTRGNNILLDLRAERSAVDVADSDVGLIFRTQEAESRVLVQDGETVVIGGLTVTERSEVRSGIPLLMNLPVLGRMFRTTRESANQRDLMILVTPTIVRRPAGP